MKHVLLVVLVGVASLLLVGGCTTINCQTDPPGAKVYVNGVCRGTTPFVSTFWLAEGITVVEAVMPGHERTECPHLTGRPPGAFLATSAPPGGQINIDGNYAGTTPQFTPIGFYHDMSLSWSAHPAQAPIQAKPPAVEQQQQQQQQQQQTVIMPGGTGGEKEAGQGTVIVSATPENCEVCVDGLFVGNAPTNLKLSEGIHIIEVKKVGHETFKRELRVLKGSEVVLRAELQKK